MVATNLTRLPSSERKLRHGAKALGPTNRHDWIEVTIKLQRAKALPAPVGRPSAVIAREDFAAYGADLKHADLVVSEFEKLGLTLVSKDLTARSVRMAGTASDVEAAFGVRLVQYQHDDETFRGRVGFVHVPLKLKDLVVGVFGLDDRRMIARRRGPQPRREVTAARAAGGRSWFKPSELATIYDFPPGDGTGESIGILEFGGGYFPDDLQLFLQTLGETSAAKIVPVSVDHTSTKKRDPNFDGEVMLDIEIVASLCPKATIPVYFGKWTEKGWIDTLDTAIHDASNKPLVLSISYGLAEGSDIWTKQALEQVNQALADAAHLGVTVCTASGDDGSDAQVGDGYAHANFPASSPGVLAVGGTNLWSDPQRTQRVKEEAWKEGSGLRASGGGSTGGGRSAEFERPSWQPAGLPSVDPNVLDGRAVPDVAALANFSGYYLVADGEGGPNGGTSAATPLWASLLCRINQALVAAQKQRVGYFTPLLYGNAKDKNKPLGDVACFDITLGDNDTASIGGYSAESGYDCVTGWGSPLGKTLLAELTKILP